MLSFCARANVLTPNIALKTKSLQDANFVVTCSVFITTIETSKLAPWKVLFLSVPYDDVLTKGSDTGHRWMPLTKSSDAELLYWC